jgi:hypothetical protein
LDERRYGDRPRAVCVCELYVLKSFISLKG